MKRAVLILLFLISLMFLCPNYSEASLKLFVGNEEVGLKNPLVMINGTYMIPLWVFEEHLDAEINVKNDEIQITLGDQTILMQLDVESAQVNGQSIKLEVAPQLIQGEIVVPLRFMADQRNLQLSFVQEINGFRLTEQAPRFRGGIISGLGLDALFEPEESPGTPMVIYEPQEIQDLKEIIFMGGPRASVFLDLQSYTGYQTHLLQEPARLVIDLYGVSGDALPVVEVDHPVLSAIRSSRFDDQIMRIVCDLKAPTGYRVNAWPDGGLEVEFNYQLSSLWVEEENDRLQIRFLSSAAPQIESTYLENPLRLVLDFQDTTLMTRSFDVPVDVERIVRLRVGQHLPAITRVVLELEAAVAPLPLEERDDGSYVLPLFAGTAREAQVYLASLNESPEPTLAELLPIREGVLSGLTVVVDPGHGGSDPGAIGYQGTFEKDVNLAIGLYLGEFLHEAGAKVVYTRDKDEYVSIFRRPEIAREARADLFISIHSNSHIERGRARGTETLYRAKDPVSERLARIVQDEVVKAITLVDRRIWGRDDLAVFNGSDIPAIMVEVGFLDHPDEEVLLRAPGFQKVAAQGIYNGIERFYLEIKK
ncbi:MAG: AMIN domain-containing protein [Firmicutes bacterium]|nr:AMIN domain-containing protein [Bacillota bacterium]